MKNIEPPTDNTPPKPKPAGKVFDVMRPGRAPASPTSKPVIVGPLMQDPSVTLNGVGAPAPTQPAQPARQVIQVTSGMRGRPIEVPNESDPEPVPVSAPEPAPEAPAEEVDALAQVAIVEGVNEGTEAINEPEPGPPPPLPKDPLLDESLAPPVEEPQGIVAPNHPLPHGSIWRSLMLFFITLLLAAAILDVLLDAGMLSAPGLPHTDFFTNY